MDQAHKRSLFTLREAAPVWNGYSNVAAVIVRNNQEPQSKPLLRKAINVVVFFLAYSLDIQYKKPYLYTIKVVNTFTPIKLLNPPPPPPPPLWANDCQKRSICFELGCKNNCSVLVTLVPYVEVILKSTFITLNLYGQPVLLRN